MGALYNRKYIIIVSGYKPFLIIIKYKIKSRSMQIDEIIEKCQCDTILKDQEIKLMISAIATKLKAQSFTVNNSDLLYRTADKQNYKCSIPILDKANMLERETKDSQMRSQFYQSMYKQISRIQQMMLKRIEQMAQKFSQQQDLIEIDIQLKINQINKKQQIYQQKSIQLFKNMLDKKFTQLKNEVKNEVSATFHRIKDQDRIFRKKNLNVQGHHECEVNEFLNVDQTTQDTTNQIEDLIFLRPIQLSQWVDFAFCQPNDSIMKGNKLATQSYTHIFGKKKIQRQFSFTVKILKTNQKTKVGLVGAKQEGENVDVKLASQFIELDSYGTIWINFIEQGQLVGQFKENEIIIIKVSLDQGFIEFKVGDSQKLRLKVDKLKENIIEWRPYIFLGNREDQVAIFQ